VSASHHELWYEGVRYRLSYVWQANLMGGRRLSGSAAERVLAALLRGGDEHRVRNAYRDFAGAFDSSRQSNAQILRWFSAALGGELGVGAARLVLVELDSSTPVFSQPRGGAAGHTRPSASSQRSPSAWSTPSQLRGAAAPAREASWIELRFVDDAGKPLAAQAFSMTLADGSTRRGTLDGSGSAYLDGIHPVSVASSFPASALAC
jgi:hypothetical protein